MAEKTKIPSELAILPVRDMVLFPGGVLPLTVGRESSLALLNSLEGPEKLLGVVAQLDPRVEEPADVDLHRVGTLARVHKTVKLPNVNNVVVFVEGIARIRLEDVVAMKPFLRARVSAVEDVIGTRDPELTALERNARELFRDVVARSPQLSDDLQTVALNIDDPVRLADFIAANLSLSTLLRQELLETADVRKRLETLVRELSKEIEVLELRNKIQEQVQEQVSQSQREYLLREQMKAIQKELGESDDSQTEIEELRKKIEESGMSAEARKESDRELKRLQKMTPASAEYMVSRTYLEWMTALPWAKSSGAEEIDIPKAQQILDEDHYDLREGEAARARLPGCEETAAGHEGPHPVLPGTSRRGQDFARKIHRQGARAQIRARVAGRHAR